ncbi:unnamed protein product [Adineta ricciae]|uniref:Tyrosine-protein kinase ephrin type A/B receptor-like domain-containing protein n=1 Tax=Adineta ricciae TaxID=249248 RepID=A0A815NR68_ADIRI|nr:unnamed protein product [Adineta ricciae]CAF1441057.1 unnamed protein product [Adineta ricciae]
MTKLLLSVFAICNIILQIRSIELEQCPPGYRCRKTITNPFVRSSLRQVEANWMMEICPPGMASPKGATECTPCEKGYYAPYSGAAICYTCPKGHMCPNSHLEPEPCPIGTSNNLTQQTCCRTCRPGTFTKARGMQQCQNCPVGYACRTKPKLPCEEQPTLTTTSTTSTTSIFQFTASTATCHNNVATPCTTTTTLIAQCKEYEVSWNNHCYYLDGSGGECIQGYRRATNAILSCIANLFVGKFYRSRVSGNCCIWTADKYQCYGFDSTQCNLPGPFTTKPTFGGANCSNVQNAEGGQLTFCGNY